MNNKIIIFDLDETLAESKCEIDGETGELLKKLLEIGKVAVISGGNKTVVFKNIFLAQKEIFKNARLENLILMPTCGSQMWTFENQQEKLVYILKLSNKEKKEIKIALKLMEEKFNLQILPGFGEKVEDRISQMAYSYFGQNAPLEVKKVFDSRGKKRMPHVIFLEKKLGKKFNIAIGGSSTIDITKPGIDKAYGAKKLMEYFNFEKKEMLFVGDKVFPGGNDYPIKKLGVKTIETTGPEMTKKIIAGLMV